MTALARWPEIFWLVGSLFCFCQLLLHDLLHGQLFISSFALIMPPYLFSLAVIKFMRFAGKFVITRFRQQRPNRTIKIPTSAQGLTMVAEVYEPSAPDVSMKQSPLPIVINLAGAGFCLDTLGSDALFCRRVADEVGCVVLDIDYAKAPERPWPNATNDVTHLVGWLRSEGAEKYGWDASRVAITGFSSGGCIALLAATQLDGFIKACCTFYPSSVLSFLSSSKGSVIFFSKCDANTSSPPYTART